VLDNSYLALIPGIAIMILVMSFNLMSMGLRDILDPYNQQ
jgi:ABC-type dipeptide/oligopeptide/nickel transport system permease subunit